MPAVQQDYQLNIPSLQVRLDALCNNPRFAVLDRLDAYAETRQYDALKYDWDGNLMGYAGEADIAPGWYVPLRQRRPNVRSDIGKLIIRRLTAMALGEDSWPQITVPGDEEAEDYAKALAEACNLEAKMQEARNRGGGCGTAVVSFSFIDGQPRVKVHEAKHMHPLRWVDRDEHTLGAVLKAYRYTRTVWGLDGKPKEAAFYFARYWDEQQEVVWDPIPEELARAGTWARVVKSYQVMHEYGECPVYWRQNLADSEREDGLSDIDGLGETIDAVNRLLSATTKGTIANVDPTLVIKDDPGANPGVVRKGSDNAIFSKGGADYLELRGDAVKTAIELADRLTRNLLDVAGVVIGDPEKMGAKAQSAAALKMLYLPMCNQCDLLRVQYGELIVAVLRGMLRAAKLINATAPGPILTTVDGRRVQQKPVVVLPPRIDVDEGDMDPTTGERPKEETMVERTPGELDRIELKWPPYFQPTLTDVNQMVEATTKAKGQVISQRTAVKYVAGVFGVTDIDKEMAEIDVERERNSVLMADEASLMADAVPEDEPDAET